MKPAFSIVIPVYNVAPYLRECLDSVLAQTFTDWEAICVDDGSTDGSGAILDEYAAKDSRLKVIHQQNVGASAARNVAIDVAGGEWLMFVDGDDVLPFDVLERLVPTIRDGRLDACILKEPSLFRDVAPTEAQGSAKALFEAVAPEQSNEIYFRFGVLKGFPWLRVLRRSVFCNVLFPVGVAMMEDDLHLLDCLRLPARWAYIDLIGYGYRYREESASRFVSAERVVEVLGTIQRKAVILSDEFRCGSVRLRQYLHNCRHIVHYYLARSFSSVDAKGRRQIVMAYLELERTVGRGAVSRFWRFRILAERLGMGSFVAPFVRCAEYCYCGVTSRLGVMS